MERAPAGALRALGALPPYFKFSWGLWGPWGPNPLFLYFLGPQGFFHLNNRADFRKEAVNSKRAHSKTLVFEIVGFEGPILIL